MDRNYYFSILKDLVGMNTISANVGDIDRTNRPLIEYAEKFLKDCGFEVSILDIDVLPGKNNLYATWGEGEGGLLLSGHSDTVPCKSEDWSSDPFTLTLRGNEAFGLGSCDMKGFIALMLCFARQASELGIKKRLGILITADEESSMDGAIDFAKKCRDRYDLIVIGEPTRLEPMVSHKGYMCNEFVFTGKSCHSSNPALGVNAIDIAYDAITMLKELQAQFMSYKDERFEVPYPTLNVGAIHGGDCSNRLCDEARILFDVRLMGEMNAGKVNPLLQGIVDRLNEKYPGRTAFNKIYADIDCFENKNREVIGKVEKLVECKSICEGYCTEASMLQALGSVVVYGPGSIKFAHKVDERIDLTEVETGYERLLRVIKEFA